VDECYTQKEGFGHTKEGIFLILSYFLDNDELLDIDELILYIQQRGDESPPYGLDAV
jgi:hypothetical protein